MSAAADVTTLLYASDRESPFHDRAVQFLTDRATTLDLLCLAWPTIMGYLRIATHPGIFARPLSAAEAMRNVNALISLPHVRLLAEEEGFWDVYQDVVRNWPARAIRSLTRTWLPCCASTAWERSLPVTLTSAASTSCGSSTRSRERSGGAPSALGVPIQDQRNRRDAGFLPPLGHNWAG